MRGLSEEPEEEPKEEAAGALDPMADAPEDPAGSSLRAVWTVLAVAGALTAVRGAIGVYCAPHGFLWSAANRVVDLSVDDCFLAMFAGLGLAVFGGFNALKPADPLAGFLYRDGKPHPPPPPPDRDWPL
jgi:hypothetical protein